MQVLLFAVDCRRLSYSLACLGKTASFTKVKFCRSVCKEERFVTYASSAKHLTRSSCSPVLRSAATPWTRACCRVTPTPTQQNSVALSHPLLLAWPQSADTGRSSASAVPSASNPVRVPAPATSSGEIIMDFRAVVRPQSPGRPDGIS
jgi:hypothetical protein